EVSVPIESLDGVIPKKAKKDQRQVETITMKVLQDERKCSLTFIGLVSAIIHRAARRIKKKRAVISLAIVVASGAEAEWAAKDKQCRRPMPPMMLSVDQ